MKPTKSVERLLDIDVLRGLAVLGMVIWDFRSRSMGQFYVGGRADGFVNWMVSASDIQNTVHLIFAFLFAWGFAQAWHKGATGGALAAVNARKLLTLFLIGVANACLFDRTDILWVFAVLGAVALLFANRSDRTVLIAAVLLIGLPVFGGRLVSEASGDLYASLDSGFLLSASYREMVLARAHELIQGFADPRTYVEGSDSLAMFLFGFWAARRGVLGPSPGRAPLLRRVLWGALAVRLLGLGWGFVAEHREVVSSVASELVAEYSKQALALFYICLVLLLMEKETVKRAGRPFADVGRMALSGYLFHCFLGTTLFFGYGLGWYGRFGMARGEALAMAAFAVIVVASRWWLRHFEFGPTEWLWRTATYWKLQPIRRSRALTAGST